MQVSVVIPTHNRLSSLKKTLQALFSQSFPKDDYEVVVVDDGSTDGTREYLGKLQAAVQFHYFFQEHGGPAKARNRGIQEAKGEIIAFTDDDCLVPKDWLEKIVAAFERHPQVVGVSGYMEADEKALVSNIYAQFEKFVPMGDYIRNEYQEFVQGKGFLGGATNNVAYKKEVLLKLGGFDENFPVPAAEDGDLKDRIVGEGYLLCHLPIKVIHKHPYSLRRLLLQAELRGRGSIILLKKNKTTLPYLRIFLSSVKISLRSLGYLFGWKVKFIPLVVLYQIWFIVGVFRP